MSPSKVNLRVDDVLGEHVHCSLFMNGAKCGGLVFRIGEYQIFGAALGLGVERTQGHLVDESDSRKFVEWSLKPENRR